jgi:hypothetical protein
MKMPENWFRAFSLEFKKGLLHGGLLEDGLVCLCGLHDAITCSSTDVVLLEIFAY